METKQEHKEKVDQLADDERAADDYGKEQIREEANEPHVYPHGEITTFQTSTVLPCAKCHQEIKMFTDMSSDGKNHWHAGCLPEGKSNKVHTTE